MILDAAAPFAAQLAGAQAGHEPGILYWHCGLIIIAVERPGLHLASVQLAIVQQPVKRVKAVVALGTYLTQGFLKRVRVEKFWRQRMILMPSWQTVQPAASASARSGLSAKSTGLELLIWIRKRWPIDKGASVAMAPFGPETLMWPIL